MDYANMSVLALLEERARLTQELLGHLAPEDPFERSSLLATLKNDSNNPIVVELTKVEEELRKKQSCTKGS